MDIGIVEWIDSTWQGLMKPVTTLFALLSYAVGAFTVFLMFKIKEPSYDIEQGQQDIFEVEKLEEENRQLKDELGYKIMEKPRKTDRLK